MTEIIHKELKDGEYVLYEKDSFTYDEDGTQHETILYWNGSDWA